MQVQTFNFFIVDLTEKLGEFIQAETDKLHDENATEVIDKVKNGEADVDALCEAWTKVFTQVCYAWTKVPGFYLGKPGLDKGFNLGM